MIKSYMIESYMVSYTLGKHKDLHFVTSARLVPQIQIGELYVRQIERVESAFRLRTGRQRQAGRNAVRGFWPLAFGDRNIGVGETLRFIYCRVVGRGARTDALCGCQNRG